jgi:hypothetical protein
MLNICTKCEYVQRELVCLLLPTFSVNNNNNTCDFTYISLSCDYLIWMSPDPKHAWGLKSHGFLWTLFHAIGHIKLANIVVKEVYIFTNQITGKRFNVLPFSILLYLYCVLSSLFSFMLLREEEKFVSSTPNTVLNVYTCVHGIIR